MSAPRPRPAFPPSWFADADRTTVRGDLVAGLAVGAMLVPQAMAYAILAGLPAQIGLYASLVPLLVYPLVGTARHLAVGIVALDMLVVGAGLARVAEPGTDTYLGLAVVLAALVGAIQIGMSLLRLGFLADLLSRPVITGFITAAAVVIAVGQTGPLLGVGLPRSEFVHEIAAAAWSGDVSIHLPTAVLGGATVALLLALRRWAPRVPAALAVVVAGIAVTWSLDLAGAGVAVTGTVPAGLPRPALSPVTPALVGDLLPLAATLALIQLMSVISIGRAQSARHRYTIRPNRELMGLGMANLAGSFFRGVPVSASFSRSAVNEQAGASTPLANVFAAATVGLTLVLLTPVLAHLPLTVLAAIIVVGVLGLVRPREFAHLVRTHRQDGAVAVLTTVATLALGIVEGILLGVLASALVVLYRASRPHIAELGLLPGTHFFRDRERFTEAESVPGILVMRIDASFSYFNASFFRDYILDRSRGAPEGGVRALILEARGINDLDTTGLEALRELVGTLDRWGIDVVLAGLKGPVRDVLERSGMVDELDVEAFHLSTHHAVRHVLERWDREEGTDRVGGYDARTGGGNQVPDHDVPLT